MAGIAQVQSLIGILVHARATGTGANQNNILKSFANAAGDQQALGVSGVAQALLDEGHKNAGETLGNVAFMVAQAADGMDAVDFPHWFRLLETVKEKLQVTPAQSAAAARPIRSRQGRLEAQIRELGGQIGGGLSVRGALVGTSTEPIQSEWAAIQAVIRNGAFTPADRESLLAKQRELLGQTGEVVVAAGREGADVADALDNLEALRQDLGGGFLDCITSGDNKAMCFIQGQGKWVTAGIIIIALGAVLWVTKPMISLYLATRRKKKRSKR